MNKKNHGDIL